MCGVMLVDKKLTTDLMQMLDMKCSNKSAGKS